MDALQYHQISESNHRMLNPIDAGKLALLGEICRLRPGDRQLDLACGKGEMLCSWASAHGIGGLGVDISPVFLTAARERAKELGVSDRVTFEAGDAGAFEPEPASYDVVSCIGATWIGDGVAGTMRLLNRAVRPGGLVLVGEPYWTEDPPDAAVTSIGVERELFTSLADTVDRIQGAGVEVVEMVLADGDSWDRYAAAQWWNVDEWLRANPDSPDAELLRTHRDQARRSHLEYQRRYLGWGVFVARAAGAVRR